MELTFVVRPLAICISFLTCAFVTFAYVFFLIVSAVSEPLLAARVRARCVTYRFAQMHAQSKEGPPAGNNEKILLSATRGRSPHAAGAER